MNCCRTDAVMFVTINGSKTVENCRVVRGEGLNKICSKTRTRGKKNRRNGSCAELFLEFFLPICFSEVSKMFEQRLSEFFFFKLLNLSSLPWNYWHVISLCGFSYAVGAALIGEPWDFCLLAEFGRSRGRDWWAISAVDSGQDRARTMFAIGHGKLSQGMARYLRSKNLTHEMVSNASSQGLKTF